MIPPLHPAQRSANRCAAIGRNVAALWFTQWFDIWSKWVYTYQVASGSPAGREDSIMYRSLIRTLDVEISAVDNEPGICYTVHFRSPRTGNVDMCYFEAEAALDAATDAAQQRINLLRQTRCLLKAHQPCVMLYAQAVLDEQPAPPVKMTKAQREYRAFIDAQLTPYDNQSEGA